jgi:hypothetical protein
MYSGSEHNEGLLVKWRLFGVLTPRFQPAAWQKMIVYTLTDN